MRVLSARLSACTPRPSPGRRRTRCYNDIILVFYINVRGRPVFSRRNRRRGSDGRGREGKNSIRYVPLRNLRLTYI